jgi:hypothetical protein
MFRDFENGVLTVTGKIADSAEKTDSGLWLFAWETERDMIPPVAGMSGAGDGMFWASFEIDDYDDVKKGFLRVRVALEL